METSLLQYMSGGDIVETGFISCLWVSVGLDNVFNGYVWWRYSEHRMCIVEIM